MPDNKRQHYVPQYSLRYFSTNSTKRQINLFNLKRAKVVRGASLRDQCYRDHFYSTKTEIEKSICQLEGAFAKLTSKILETEQLDSADAAMIILMIALQRGRTLRAAEEVNAMVDKYAKLALYNRIDEKTLQKVRIGLSNVAQHIVARTLTLSPMLLDLEQFLLVNETDTPFIIGDSPVVTTNWFCRLRFRHCGLNGLARTGLQMAMPLAPRCAILLHDRYVYAVKDRSNVIVLDQTKDVQNLNGLQLMNAYQNIYFSSGFSDDHLAMLREVQRPVENDLVRFSRFDAVGDNGIFRPTAKNEYAGPSEGVTRELVVAGASELPMDIRLRGIGVRARPRYYDDGSAASPVRDYAWCRIVEDFSKAIEEGRALFHDLGAFVEHHPLWTRIGTGMRSRLRNYKFGS